MNTMHKAALFAAIAAASANAQTIDLAGTAAGDSRISEFAVTGSFAQIDMGDGSPGDADGLYSVVDGASFGIIDVFPNETAFGLGDLTYDAGSLTGSGVETVAVTNIDLSDFWASGSSTTDVSDAGLALWFFGAPTAFNFGGLDAADTVTFTDGVLTSIDIQMDAALTIDYTFTGNPFSYDGTFSISGADFTLSIDDTVTGIPNPFGGPDIDSRLVADIRGTVAAVVPAPSSGALLGLGLIASARRRQVAR
ncbi:MAG: PEP-CTERM sorting domain-containing protein [Planctomycetota bacterium]